MRHETREDEEGGFAMGDLLIGLRRRVWLIVLLTALGGAIGAGIALLLPRQYDAVATIQIDPRKKTIVSLDAVLPDIAGDTATIESQVEVIKSKVIALKVIDALGLRHDPEFDGVPATTAPGSAAREAARNDARRSIEAAEAIRRVTGPDATTIGSDRPERDAVTAVFASRLKAVRIRNSLVVEITFRSKDPVKAARIANTIAEVYIRDQIDMKIKATGLAADLLAPKLDGLRAKLTEAEQKVARFKSENGIIDAEGQLLSEKHLARMLEQSVTARTVTAEARARYEQMQAILRSGNRTNVGEVIQSPSIRTLKDQLARSTKQEAELLTKYGLKHPEIAKVRAQIADIEGQISSETDKILVNVKNEYEVAADRERMLEQNLSQLKSQQSVTKEMTVQLRDLERESETSRKVFEAFLARYKQTLETQDLHLPDARIVEKADVPSTAAAPKRKQIALIGLVLGLGLGMGLAALMELMRTGLSRSEETEAVLGLPLLATVPLSKRWTDGLTDPLLSLRIVLAQPHSAFALAIAKLRDGLDRRRYDGGSRVVLFTASLPNEGTTIMAANYALAAAGQGRRVLLIDADMRRSRLTQHLGLDQSPGLADAIGHGQDFETVILQDTTTGLAVMPAGDVGRFPFAPQDALEAPGFAQRLARLKTHFDMIVVDSPPLLPVVDARLLAGYADDIVLVATWQKTPRELLRKSVRLLGGNAARLSGVVLNRIDAAAISPETGSPWHTRRTPTLPLPARANRPAA